MISRKPTCISAGTKAAAITTVVLAVSVGAALAGTFSGDGTIVGSNGADTITAGQDNDTLWGLGGTDKITAGNGNDVIDGDGHCLPGVAPGVYPNGLPKGDYCEHGPIPGDGGDTITAGNGNDTVFGGGGHNSITVGKGDDTIVGGPLGDHINAGSGYSGNDDRVYLGRGASYAGSTVYTSAGDNVVHAQNEVKDTIYCARPNGTTVYADTQDVVTGCARVIYSADPGATFRPAASVSPTHRPAHRVARKTKHHRKHHH
jgi:Ca2+-binding RTX toxin-like protein